MKVRFKRVRTVLILLVVPALGAFAALRVPAVQDWLFVEGVKRGMAVHADMTPAEGHLKVLLCGTSAPPPSMVRAKACTVVMAGKHVFVVDTGPGSANRLGLWRFPFERIEGVMLTHFHSDHIGDLGEVRMQGWVAGRTAPLPLYGPTGVEEIAAGVNRTYAADAAYRAGEHELDAAAAELAPMPFGLAEEAQRVKHDASAVIHDKDGLRITAFQVMHEPVYPAVGYRFDYMGRSVVISGDTAVSPNLVRAAKDADLLVHEGQSEAMRRTFAQALAEAGRTKLAKVIGQVGNYHVTPVQAAEAANAAKVRLLVFNHMGPIAPDNWLLRQIFARGLADVRPASGWTLGYDGMILDLPVGSKEIVERRVD